MVVFKVVGGHSFTLTYKTYPAIEIKTFAVQILLAAPVCVFLPAV
ncbi:hypothetical protein P8864_05200 [Priestia flexa]|nr:hypothetical protein [Priestia flexa]MEC0665336.1 hypothetical protein [Priestia flexa]